MALSRRDKQKIADLRKRQSSSLVFRGGKKLTGEEMTQRRAGIERDIRGIESRAGVAPRPSPRRSSVSSVSDTNINDLMVRNLGQQGGLPTPRVPRTGYEPRLSQSFSDVRTPERDMSSIPSIFSQYVPGGDVVYKQGFAQRSDELSPSLMDTLRANTGAFSDNIRLPGGLEIRRNAPRYNPPSVTSNPYVSGQQTFTPPDTKFGFDFNLPTSEVTEPTVSRPPSPYSTVGQFGEGLLTALADAGATYNPPYGVFDVRVAPFSGIGSKTLNETLQSKMAESRQKYPYIRAQVDPRLTTPSTVGFGGINLSASATGREYSPSGNPMGLLFAPEIERRFGPAISSALDGKSYTLY
jgi:hypothetical protein